LLPSRTREAHLVVHHLEAMKSVACIVFALALLASPVGADVTVRSLSSTGSPVERVVNLLKDMKEKLEMDEKVEQKVYDKYACWCEHTTERKANAISDAQDDIREFGQTILSVKGFIATRDSEIAELEAAIKANHEAQAEATSIRSKENGAYVSETTELKEAIAAMEKAVTVLVAGSKQSLLQASTAKAQVRAIVSSLPVSKGVKPEQIALLSEYLSSDAGAKYAPQSMTVQGILKDMYETFATDLESATQAEATSNKNFEAFIAEKTAELKEDEADKEKKEGEKAEAEQRLADTQNMYDDTVAQKDADIKFFDVTKAACEEKHEEWTTRSSLREEELAGISKAMEILTSDEARELFASAIKEGKETGMDNRDTGRDIAPSFLQLDGTPAARAYATMKSAASHSHSFRLAALALEVRSAKVGHFEKVIVAIDNMVEMLKKEDAADIAKRDQCKDEYLNIESTVKALDWKIEKNVAKIDKLTKLIELREEQKARTIEQINEVEAHMKAITAERTAENAAFMAAKLEDQQAIDLLMAARDAMAKFYKKNDIEMGPIQGSVKGVFAQQEPEFVISADQAPDAVFSGKGQRKGESKDIVSILTMIIEDLNDEVKNGMKGEESAQLDYEAQMDAAQQLHDELVSKKVALEAAIAKRTEERTDEMEDKEENEKSLQDEVEYKKSITPDCDWILKAFDGRARARASEMNGLVGAKEFLVGKNSLIETQKTASAHSFDDSMLAKVRFLGLRR